MTRTQQMVRRWIGVALTAIVAAAMLTGCGDQALAARAAILGAIEDLPDVEAATGVVSHSSGGSFEVFTNATVTATMRHGAPLTSYTRVADVARAAGERTEAASLILQDAEGGFIALRTDTPPTKRDAATSAWYSWSTAAEQAEVTLTHHAKTGPRSEWFSLDITLILAETPSPGSITTLVRDFQEAIPAPLSSMTSSLHVRYGAGQDQNADGGITSFYAQALPVPETALTTITALDEASTLLDPMGASIRSLAWYVTTAPDGTQTPDQLSVSVGFPDDAALRGSGYAAVQASPQWSAFQQATTIANTAEIPVGFDLQIGQSTVSTFQTRPCGPPDDDHDAERPSRKIDDELLEWWLAQAPPCDGVGRHD